MATSLSHQKDMNFILASLKDIADAVVHAAEAETLEQVLERIARVAQQVVRAKYAALGVPDGMGSLEYFKVVGVDQDTIHQIGHFPVGKGLLGVIMNERSVLRLEHMQDDPRSVGFPKHHPEMKSLLGAPIQAGDQLYGMLYLCDREDGEPFTEEDEWLVETLAGYAALAIAGVHLSEQKGRLILLEERDRVGRELHDGIIQSLYAIGMQLQLMRLSETTTPHQLDPIVRDLDSVIEDIRHYIMNLKLANYSQKTVAQCLHDVVVRLHVPERIAVEIDAPDRLPPFADPIFESVCQIAHEAISNVVRHAEATQVRIVVTESDAEFRLVVEDNGVGFSLDQLQESSGLGVRNMQQRARIHGGSIRVVSEPGAGTRLVVTIPVSPTM